MLSPYEQIIAFEKWYKRQRLKTKVKYALSNFYELFFPNP